MILSSGPAGWVLISAAAGCFLLYLTIVARSLLRADREAADAWSLVEARGVRHCQLVALAAAFCRDRMPPGWRGPDSVDEAAEHFRLACRFGGVAATSLRCGVLRAEVRGLFLAAESCPGLHDSADLRFFCQRVLSSEALLSEACERYNVAAGSHGDLLARFPGAWLGKMFGLCGWVPFKDQGFFGAREPLLAGGFARSS